MVGFAFGLWFPRPLLRMAVLLSVAGIAAVMVVLTPRLAIWFALAVPAIELVVPISTVRVLGLGLMAVAVGAGWRTATERERRAAMLFVGTLCWIGFAGLVLAPRGPTGIQFFLGIAFSLLLGATVAVVGFSPASVRASLAMWGAGVACVAITTPGLIDDRSQAVIGENANGLGTICALGLVASAQAAFLAKRALHWGLPVAVLCGVAVVATGSRGAMVTAVLGCVAVLIAPYIRRSGARTLFVGAVLAFILAVSLDRLLIWFTAFVGRSAESFSTVAAREEVLWFALKTGVAHPISGVGLGRLSEVSFQDPSSRLDLRAHNIFAGIFAESGVVALALVLTVFLLALVRSRLSTDGLFPLVVAVTAAAATYEWWGTAKLSGLAVVVLAAASVPSSLELSDERSSSQQIAQV